MVDCRLLLFFYKRIMHPCHVTSVTACEKNVLPSHTDVGLGLLTYFDQYNVSISNTFHIREEVLGSIAWFCHFYFPSSMRMTCLK